MSCSAWHGNWASVIYTYFGVCAPLRRRETRWSDLSLIVLALALPSALQLPEMVVSILYPCGCKAIFVFPIVFQPIFEGFRNPSDIKYKMYY